MVEEFGRPLEEKMYAELADKFRLDKNRLMARFRDNRGLAYRTSAEAKKERLVDGHTFSLNSILNDYIEEKGRFIAKGSFSDLWIFRYREQIHPELLAPDEIGTSGMSFGGGIPWGRASDKQIMHAENSKLISCPQPSRKKNRVIENEWENDPAELIRQFGGAADFSSVWTAPSPGHFVDNGGRRWCSLTVLAQRGYSVDGKIKLAYVRRNRIPDDLEWFVETTGSTDYNPTKVKVKLAPLKIQLEARRTKDNDRKVSQLELKTDEYTMRRQRHFKNPDVQLSLRWSALQRISQQHGNYDRQLFCDVSKLISFPKEHGEGVLVLEDRKVHTCIVRISVSSNFPKELLNKVLAIELHWFTDHVNIAVQNASLFVIVVA